MRSRKKQQTAGAANVRVDPEVLGYVEVLGPRLDAMVAASMREKGLHPLPPLSGRDVIACALTVALNATEEGRAIVNVHKLTEALHERIYQLVDEAGGRVRADGDARPPVTSEEVAEALMEAFAIGFVIAYQAAPDPDPNPAADRPN